MMKQHDDLLREYQKAKNAMKALEFYRKAHCTYRELQALYTRPAKPAVAKLSSPAYTSPKPGIYKLHQRVELTHVNVDRSGIIVSMPGTRQPVN
jgi:hypothetical protein